MAGKLDKKRWATLSPRTRKLIIGAGLAEGTLKVSALVDIARRPASQIRGRKLIWVPVIIVVNSFGVVPLVYFLFGRRPHPEG